MTNNGYIRYMSTWSSCSAVLCGTSDSQFRTVYYVVYPGMYTCYRTVQRSRACYGTQAADCNVTSWSSWSSCSAQSSRCGGSQRSSRYILSRERCGGTPCNMTALRKTRACKQTFCVNQGTLLNGQCACKPGYYGSCCQYNRKSTYT